MTKGKREKGEGVFSPSVADQQTQANPVGKQRGEEGPIAEATQRTSKGGERMKCMDLARKLNKNGRWQIGQMKSNQPLGNIAGFHPPSPWQAYHDVAPSIP